jgi:integrase
MPTKPRIPSYRRHKQSGQAIVTLTDGLGNRRDVLLGKYGTAASHAEYDRVTSEWKAGGRRALKPTATSGAVVTPDITIAELLLRFLDHAKEHYRYADGGPTNELGNFQLSFRPLNYLYGGTLASDFGPLALKSIRQIMIDGYEHRKYGSQRSLSRGVINQRVGRIRSMFKWAVENQLIHESVWRALEAVAGLQRGRSSARETQPIKPVPEAFVNQTLPYLLPPVAAMARLQLLAGMRPGEVVIMRAIDIDMSGKVWLYRPGSDQGPDGAHKTAYRGHKRVIALGPRAQAIVRDFLKTDVQAFLFTPRDAMEWRMQQLRAARKTKVQPSQVCRKSKRPKKHLRDHYGVRAYGLAIQRACVKADVPHWHPHQLRHTKATEIRREFGIDVARAVLGHRSPVVTEVYAELDAGKAMAAMERLG